VPELTCKNCFREVVFTGPKEGYETEYTHVFGLRRCMPGDSGRPYEDRLQADVDVPPETDE
jgi:hypothetical protein